MLDGLQPFFESVIGIVINCSVKRRDAPDQKNPTFFLVSASCRIKISLIIAKFVPQRKRVLWSCVPSENDYKLI